MSFCYTCRVIPLKRAAEEKAQVLRIAAATSFKSMLRDKGDITVDSRWSKVGAVVQGSSLFICWKSLEMILLCSQENAFSSVFKDAVHIIESFIFYYLNLVRMMVIYLVVLE